MNAIDTLGDKDNAVPRRLFWIIIEISTGIDTASLCVCFFDPRLHCCLTHTVTALHTRWSSSTSEVNEVKGTVLGSSCKFSSPDSGMTPILDLICQPLFPRQSTADRMLLVTSAWFSVS
jgi:hypothetical protein